MPTSAEKNYRLTKARLAAASRYGTPEEVEAARAGFNQACADLEVREQLIRAAVAAAPPLTADQIEQLRDLLAPPADRVRTALGHTGQAAA